MKTSSGNRDSKTLDSKVGRKEKFHFISKDPKNSEKLGGGLARINQRSRTRRRQLNTIDRIEKYLRTLEWIRSEFIRINRTSANIVEPLLLKVTKIWINRGKAYAISWLKQQRIYFLGYLSGNYRNIGSKRSRRKA